MCTNGAAKSVMPMNYYVPSHEEHAVTDTATSSRPRRASRILGRRYGLTSTSYKFLEIGISVGPASYVEIVIGDNRGNHLILSHQIWKELMYKRADIDRQLAETSPLWIRDLSITRDKWQNVKILKLTLFGNSLYITRETFDTLFIFEQCIDRMYGWLYENTHLVNAKFQKFVNILQQHITCDTSKPFKWSYVAQTLRDTNDFDCDSLIDCELLACALPDIVYHALGK